jgi:triosephosphate isomerase
MRKKIVAGNWKMNTTPEEGLNLVIQILHQVRANDKREVIFFPPFTHLDLIQKNIQNQPFFSVGAQNCSNELKGAYTGEISVKMLQAMNISWVMIGHSERRQIFSETSALLQKKTTIAVNVGMNIMFCCGETLEERESGDFKKIIETQLNDSLFHVDKEKMKTITIAYEPVWAIGTGKTATPEQAEEIHAFIRSLVQSKYDDETARQIRILYGGSVKADNANQLFNMPNIDGALVGGASLIANEFCQIISAAE